MLRFAKPNVSKNQWQSIVRNHYNTSLCASSPSVASLSYRYNSTSSGGPPVSKEIAPCRRMRNASLPRERQLTSIWKLNLNQISGINAAKIIGTGIQRRLLSTTGNNETKTFAQVVEGSKKAESGKTEAEKTPFLANALLVSAIVVSLAGAPFVLKEMKESTYEYDEIDADEAYHSHIKDAVNEAEGELRSRVPILEQNWETKKVAGNTANVVSEVLNSEALQNAVSTLIANVMESSQFQSACQVLLKNLWNDLVSDPETTAQIVLLLNTAIQNEKIKRSFKELVIGLLQDEEVYNELTSLVVRLGEETEVLDATKELLTVSAHKALNDPEILDHSMEFATDVVGDDVVQRTSGEALRNTVTYAVRPSLSAFFSVFGVALLLFSASALKNAHVSALESKKIDAAASIVLKNVGDVVISALAKVASVPFKAVSAFCSAIVTTISFPFQIIVSTLSMVGGVGGTTFNGIHSILAKVLSLPGMVTDAISLSITNLLNSLISSTRWLYSSPKLLTETVRKLGSSAITAIGELCAVSFKHMKGSLQELLRSLNPWFSLTSIGSSFSIHIRSYFLQVSKASIGFVVTGSKACIDYLAMTGIRLVHIFSNLFKKGRGDENAKL